MPPNHPLYLNTEFVGHTFPTKTIDNVERLREHTLRHARTHDQLASNPQYAGGIGWCAFDYNTHGDFGSGDRICYHGVMDIFREPKPAAGFYRSQCDPDEEIVLAPAFHWARGDESIGFTRAVVCSNCDHLKFYMGGTLVAEADPDRKEFPHLKYAPFSAEAREIRAEWGDLRIDGYIEGKLVISRTMSGKGVDQRFALLADDTTLVADGADTTRVVLRVTDEFDAIRPFANDPIQLELTGPAELIGDNPFALVGGTGAVGFAPPNSPAQCGSRRGIPYWAHSTSNSRLPPRHWNSRDYGQRKTPIAQFSSSLWRQGGLRLLCRRRRLSRRVVEIDVAQLLH